jgi:hypothetical protein
MKIIIMAIMIITSINVYADELPDKMIYKIGYEVGFEAGAKKVNQCIENNIDKYEIKQCVNNLIKKVNSVKSHFPNTKRLSAAEVLNDIRK